MSLKKLFASIPFFGHTEKKESRQSVFTYYFGCPENEKVLWLNANEGERTHTQVTDDILGSKIRLMNDDDDGDDDEKKGAYSNINPVATSSSRNELSTGHMEFDISRQLDSV